MGVWPRLTLTRLKVCSRLRRKNIQIHHRGDGRNVADLTALSHDLGNLAFLRPNGPENKVNSNF